jgi:hypothetical protein
MLPHERLGAFDGALRAPGGRHGDRERD